MKHHLIPQGSNRDFYINRGRKYSTRLPQRLMGKAPFSQKLSFSLKQTWSQQHLKCSLPVLSLYWVEQWGKANFVSLTLFLPAALHISWEKSADLSCLIYNSRLSSVDSTLWSKVFCDCVSNKAPPNDICEHTQNAKGHRVKQHLFPVIQTGLLWKRPIKAIASVS